MVVMLLEPIKAVYWRIRIVLFACRWIFAYNLGDLIIFQGETWALFQGVRKPVWRIHRVYNNVVMHKTLADVHEKDFKKVLTFENCWHSFKSGYRFYMTSWYRIWMNNGIEPWMKDCNIWKRKK